MERLPSDSPKHELPSYRRAQKVRLFTQRYRCRIRCFVVLMGIAGCAHGPLTKTETNIPSSMPAKTDDNHAEEKENGGAKDSSEDHSNCRMLRIVPCEWIQYDCGGRNKPVSNIACC